MDHFSSIQQFYTYQAFEELMSVLVAAGKTTGANQTESLINFTKLNFQRQQRWNKTFVLDEALSIKAKTAKPQIWWVLTEAWCGDSAQNLPIIAKISEASAGNIALRILLRDENLSIMDNYLTNGGRSIPKLIAIDKTDNELFTWGPRPAPVQQIMIDWKANSGSKTHDDVEREIHTWYARDKGEHLQAEFLALLNK